MKTIQVKVTDAQFAFVQAIASQFYRLTEGELLLAAAFGGLSVDSDDLQIDALVAQIKAYVEQGGVPDFDPSEFIQVGVKTLTNKPAKA